MPRSIEGIRMWINSNLQSGGEPGRTVEYANEEVRTLLAEVDRLNALINAPSVDNFLEAVRLEAAHQQERWAADHDAGKADADWFWLLGYLAGKVLRPAPLEKKLHHVITTAAVCLNWHAHLTGDRTGMRPGIADPEASKVLSHG